VPRNPLEYSLLHWRSQLPKKKLLCKSLAKEIPPCTPKLLASLGLLFLRFSNFHQGSRNTPANSLPLPQQHLSLNSLTPSPLIFIRPACGGIQLGTFPCILSSSTGRSFDSSRSPRNFSTKQWINSGLWKELSCIAFCLACQIAYILIANLTKSSCNNVANITTSQPLGLF